MSYLLEWFWDLASARPVSGNGPQAIPAAEIASWCWLRGIRLRGWEFRALRALDARWLDVARELTERNRR